MSKRAPAEVLADLQADDLSVLRYVDASIDTAAQAVTARMLGVERRAVYREDLGDTLTKRTGRNVRPAGRLPSDVLARIRARMDP